MNPTTTLQEVQEWPAEDRLALVFELWDQLVDNGWQPEPTEELAQELDSRLAAHDAAPADVRSWEQMVARVGISSPEELV